MTIRSVDLQTMIPRLTESSRQQANADVAPLAAQHVAAAHAQERAARSQHQVLHKAPADQAGIRKDREGNGQQQAGGREPEARQGGKEPEKKGQPERRWGNRLDVRV